ncbi:zinc finger CCCH domain-containing protein 11A-like isoform X2 [Tribolium madens]|nr:zinc finger CCCH domain-containing protein 11A-like isoform X2 [Tribolium madens]
MTDLESPKKNNDCYFYYYSTCAKGDNCTFRHEPSALGCETMCSFWKEGKCLNVHCNFRHMELRKNRKAIPCYWESQPGGCLKPHCPFLHQSPKPATVDESHESKTDSGTESADNSVNEKLSHLSEKGFKNPPVDSLVVNFEEESDNESAPTNSPIKSNHRAVKVKTLEEIKLEKIQAESAAYYSYPEDDGEDLRQRIWERFSSKNAGRKTDLFGIKRQHETNITGPLSKKPKKTETDVSEIKIKTLEEIRAERAKKASQTLDAINTAICDSCVSSSTEDTQNGTKKAKIKLQREPPYIQEKKEEKQTNETKVEVDKASDSDVDMNQSNNNKTADEILLLQDDDDNCNVSLKEEERLLNDLDEFLED